MSTVINRQELLQQLEAVQPGLSPREIVEQSSCFVFCDGNVITYNDEVAVQHECCLKIKGAVQATPLLAILSKLVEDELIVEPAEGELILSGKRRRCGIRMESEISLPVENIEKPGDWKLLHEDFVDGIQIVEQCASKDESRFGTTCIHIHPKWVEATDSIQIARYKMSTGFDKPIFVRSSSIKNIVPLDVTEFSETESWVHFRNPAGVVLSCRRHVDVEYAELGPYLKFTGEPITLPKALLEAVTKAEIFSSENSDENYVLIELRDGKLRIKGQGSLGWYSEVAKVKYHGPALGFLIGAKLLGELTQRHNECEIGPERLKVSSGKFTYITCLHKPKEDND